MWFFLKRVSEVRNCGLKSQISNRLCCHLRQQPFQRTLTRFSAAVLISEQLVVRTPPCGLLIMGVLPAWPGGGWGRVSLKPPT